MGEERFDPDPLAAPFRQPEVRLPDPIEQSDLGFVGDVQVEHAAVQLAHDVLSRQPVLDQEAVEDLPRPEEFPLERLLDQLLDLLRSDRAGDLVQDVRVDRRPEPGRGLQGIPGTAHVPLGDVHEGLHALIRDLEFLRLRDAGDVFSDRLGLQRSETEDGRPRLDRFDEARRLVRGQDEPRSLRIRLHRAAHCRLRVRGQVVGLVEEDDLEARPAEGREARDLFDLRADGLDAALVAAVQLVVILAPVLAEHVARQGHRGGRLAGARGAREEEVREVRLLRICLEPLDDLVLADDLVEGLRAILLDPDFLHLRPRVRVSSGGRVLSLWRRGSEVARIVASRVAEGGRIPSAAQRSGSPARTSSTAHGPLKTLDVSGSLRNNSLCEFRASRIDEGSVGVRRPGAGDRWNRTSGFQTIFPSLNRGNGRSPSPAIPRFRAWRRSGSTGWRKRCPSSTWATWRWSCDCAITWKVRVRPSRCGPTAAASRLRCTRTTRRSKQSCIGNWLALDLRAMSEPASRGSSPSIRICISWR